METQLGRYVIQSEIGRGAMGIVYKATDTVLERTVAVKTVNMALEREGADRYEERFYQEARAAAGLNHQNIVVVHDVGKAGEVVFMAMELIEGVELRSLIGEGRSLRVPQALNIAAQIAEGLAYAHARGVVHRDIKPANIMVVANGPVKITDFGIARKRASKELTQTGSLLGSPKYMSPEQVIGKRADHRSDIFSLGVILYEMLAGAAPFNGENVTALMYQIVNFVPPAPGRVNRDVPPLADAIVAKMLAKPLEERYQDTAELARDLRECERSVAAGGAPAHQGAAPPPAAGATVAPEPQHVDDEEKTVVLAQPVNRTRNEDRPENRAPDHTMPPAKGLAAAFDSNEATQRLAALTGTATLPAGAPQTATQAVRSLAERDARQPRTRWRKRDWALVAGAALIGAVVVSLTT